MRLRRLCPASALISVSAILLFLFCSRSDVITGAGGSVVKDFNPDLTDLGRGFVTLSLYGDAVDSVCSLPESPNPLFATRAAADMLIGLSEDGDTLAAHIQYRAAGGAPYSADDFAPYASYICFRAADSGGASSGQITLFPSDTLRGLAPVNRADMNNPPVGAGDSGAAGKGGFSLNGKNIDSLPLPADLTARIFKARASKDTAAAESFAFSIVDYAGPLLKVDNPYIVVVVRKKQGIDSVFVSDTIRGFTRYTVFENAAAAAERARAPYSSQLTQRTALFRVDMTGVFDTLSRLGLSGGGSELLNAVISVQHRPEGAAAGGAPPEDSLSSRKVGNYKALILDTLLTDEILLDSAAAATSRLLYDEFARVGSTAPASPYNTHDFRAAMRGAADRYGRGEAAKPYIYVYLRPIADGSVIVWDKPLKIETVFTPSRTQSR